MGARESRQGYKKWDLNELSQATGLSVQQVGEIYQEFVQAAGSDGCLDMNEFTRLYNRFPGSQQQDPRYLQQQITRIFRTFDRDGSKSLSFDEFLSAVVMMNHDMPRRDRIDFLIRQNNASGRHQGDARITPQYGHQVFRRLNDYYGLPAGTEHQCWQEVDQQNRGYITEEELMNYIAQQDAYTQQYQF